MIPAQYQFLTKEPGPKMLIEGLKLYGVKEFTGAADNPIILGWAAEVGLSKVYSDDAIPWCGLYMAVIAKRAGKHLPANPLWAADWLNFGVPTMAPMLGDVLVVTRTGGNHVALIVGEDEFAYHVLGGNQSDAVTFTRILKSRKPKFRRPHYINQPANVRRILLGADGPISAKEA